MNSNMAQAKSGGPSAPAFQMQNDRLSAEPARLRVLIVEDELFVALHLEGLVEDIGHMATLASTGEDAVAEIAARRPDIVLLDVNLGRGISGVEVAEGLRGSETRIVFITAYADDASRQRMQDAAPGCLILSKPVSDETVKRAIEDPAPLRS